MVLALTMAVAKDQRIIEAGRAIIYRIVRVKLNKRKRFPSTPKAREVAFRPMHLDTVSLGHIATREYRVIPSRISKQHLHRVPLRILLFRMNFTFPRHSQRDHRHHVREGTGGGSDQGNGG